MLAASYSKVAPHLQPQVQGTCGVYSFYNAVCILRDLDARNPAVPAPKKSQAKAHDATGGAFKSLREYSKRELKSGQGEILSEREMMELVAAHGYSPMKLRRHGTVELARKKEFLMTCAEAAYPVLVPYLADQVGAEIKYVGAVTARCGAHWSLIIGIEGDNAQVVEPNAPKVLKLWPLADLMQSNSKTDDKKFVEYWAKTVYSQAEFDRQTMPGLKATIAPVSKVRSIAEYPADPKTFAPDWNKAGVGKTKLYDLGGDDQKRQDKQDLNHVLIAIVPPFTAAPAKTT